MEKSNLPIHLQRQLQQGNGASYRTALKFRPEDVQNFGKYEYEIANLVGAEKFGKRCRVMEQELVITKRVYDILTVATIGTNPSRFKIFYDITLVPTVLNSSDN